MTWDLSGLFKDTSNADGGKIGSALTLGVNCSTDEGGKGGLLQQSGDAESKSRGRS